MLVGMNMSRISGSRNKKDNNRNYGIKCMKSIKKNMGDEEYETWGTRKALRGA